MRYAIGVEYDGSDYSGWQSQPTQPTVQACVEKALSEVVGSPDSVSVFCSGRTDAGVHALNQVIHFDTDVQRDEKAWLFGGNANLPDDIALRWARPVDDDFHARFSAVSRHYRYLLNNARTRPALASRRSSWQSAPLDVTSMDEACQALLGEQDFTSFRAAECQAKTPNRHISSIRWHRMGTWLQLDIQGNAFLHHMVRNIVGSSILVGAGKRPVAWMAEVLAARDRCQAGPTAAAQGLYFLGAEYPGYENLPRPEAEKLWSQAGLV